MNLHPLKTLVGLVGAVWVLTLSGCGSSSRIVGKWEGTLEDKPVKIEFTSAGKFRVIEPGQSEDQAKWEDWSPGDDKGKKTKFTFRGKAASATFRGENEFSAQAGSTRMDLKREGTGGFAGGLGGEARPDKEYIMPYTVVVFAVALGLVCVCRPARRENEPKWPAAVEE